MRLDSDPPFQVAGLLWALVLTLALAVVCRFLPGGTGDRTRGVAVGAVPRD